MAHFAPYARTTELPKVGTALETLALEFKKDFSSPYKAAKAVATMANAVGGVVIVGAVHDQAQWRLVRYESIAIGPTEQMLSQAVEQLCRPAPLGDHKEEAHDAVVRSAEKDARQKEAFEEQEERTLPATSNAERKSGQDAYRALQVQAA